MKKTRLITFVGVMSALSFILYFFEFPLFFYFPAYLKIDFTDIPAILGGIAVGPAAGVAIELIKNVLHFIMRSNTPFASGEIANFFAGAGLLVPIAIMIRKNKKSTFFAYMAGAVSMTIVVNIINYFVTLPLYGVPAEARLETVLYTLVPFNLIKAVIVSVITAVLYSKLRAFFNRFLEG